MTPARNGTSPGRPTATPRTATPRTAAPQSATPSPAVPRTTAPRPVVGIVARTAPVTLHGVGMTVGLTLQRHVDFLAAAGCTPVVLPLVPGAEELLRRMDGLLVPGGPDLDPALYGGAPHPATRGGSPHMDRAELALVAAALTAGIPVLGICRGMQVLNVLRGGTLHQHLPEVTGHDDHSPRTEAYTLGRLRLDLAPGSRVAGILADGAAEAACHHHQAIDRLGTDLVATAWAPDGTVEAVEATDHPFAVGVQWEAGQTDDERLHEALAEAAGHTSTARAPGRTPPTRTPGHTSPTQATGHTPRTPRTPATDIT